MPEAVATLRVDDELTRRRHAAALARLIRGEVRFGAHDRMLYATDASLYQVEPIGVVIPRDVDDVKAALAYCREHGLAVLPRGGGTSLAGQCTNHAVVMDFSAHLTGLEWVSPESRACGVQPGITIDDLNDQLREHGLFFPPDPATARQCNIGGAIGNNAAGTRSILYGRTSESIEAVGVFLASGEEMELAEGSFSDRWWRDAELPHATRARADSRLAAQRWLGQGVVDICVRHERLIRERFPKTIRRNAGYALDMMLEDIDEARQAGRDPLETLNLAHLICGSEGTLAIVTGATLTLHPIPKAKGLAVLGFASLEEAIDLVVPLLALKPSAVELLDDMIVGLARQNIEYARYVDLMPAPRHGRLEAVLYVEFFSHEGQAEIEAKFAELRAVVGKASPRAGVACYTNAAQMADALKLRKAGEPLLHGIPGDRKPLGFVEDNAVPVEHLAEFVREFKAIIERHGTRAAFWAHASVGVLHVRPLLDLRSEGDRKHMEAMAVEVADLARSLGGVMSGEHGDGRVRGPLLERYFGPELMGAFREVKRLFDPQNLLNPGNIVPLGEQPLPIETIHEATRVRPAGANVGGVKIDSFFDFSADHGYDHAVELCNGAGVCRKKQGGTMCPSYMATLDERHSTRGRGNALRLAITGQLDGAGNGGGPRWGDEETLKTLDLCLSCKACKTECPSNVDIAAYKAEYLAQTYRAAGRTPIRSLVFGNVRLLNRVGSALAPFSNWIANAPLHRMLVDPALGLARQRTLPAFAKSLFRRVRRAPDGSAVGDSAAALPHDAPAVVLYADCFTTYNEPRIGLATIRVLNAFGYRVVLPKVDCCGRAAISTGFLEDARRSASAAAESLIRAAREHDAKAVVVCEPSCLSAIKDDWHKLRLTIDWPLGMSLRDLAAISWLPEEFLDLQWDRHPRRPSFNPPKGAVALHGHCHQKALWGAESSARLLRRIAGERVRVLDTGCCGMAGSFGYAASRYELSMKIGELALFPAVRSLRPDDIIVAPGTSCRHQIQDGVRRKAFHPMEMVAEALRKDERKTADRRSR